MADRLPPVPVDRMTPAQQQAIEEFVRLRGKGLFGPFVPLLRSPDVMLRVAALGEQVRYGSALPSRLTELIILFVSSEWSQPVEWQIHAPLAREAGIPDAVIQAIAEHRYPAFGRDDDEIVFALCRQLHDTRHVADATYARAVSLLGEQGVVDLIVTVGYYTLLAMVMNTAHTSLSDVS